ARTASLHATTLPLREEARVPRSRQVGATYSADGAHISVGSAGFLVSAASIRRSGSATSLIPTSFAPHTQGATYGAKHFLDSFSPSEGGIEQSFTITQRIRGQRPLSINVPVSGVKATNSGL